MDDLFLKIERGDIPSLKVYEDSKTFAILDIHPHTKGHSLVIPKKRYQNIFDIPEDVLCEMMRTVRTLAPAIMKATGAEGMNIGMNNGRAAGQEIMHAHIHIIPRFEGDNVYRVAKHTSYEEGEAEKVAKQIQANL